MVGMGFKVMAQLEGDLLISIIRLAAAQGHVGIVDVGGEAQGVVFFDLMIPGGKYE